MPGIEVFTISGAPIWLGANPGLSPDGGAYMPDDDAPAPAPSKTTALVPARSNVSPPAQLQNALRALGVTTGNTALMIDVDGVIGPRTVKAVNLALSTYVGSTPQFPRADLTTTRVQQYAGSLAAIISERVRRSGGVVPAPQMKKARPRSAASSFMPQTIPTTTSIFPTMDKKWVWWLVGGAGLLVVLSAAASAARKRREARR